MNKLHFSVPVTGVLLYIIIGWIMPAEGHWYDMLCWSQWAEYLFNHGLGNIYKSGTNYLPGHLYELWIYSLFKDSSEAIFNGISAVKFVTLLFDMGSGLLLASFAKNKVTQNILLLVYFLNPAILHNSVLWGQFDSVFTFFAFASFISLLREKFYLAILLFIVSLNFKLQAVIFAPAFGLMLLVHIIEQKNAWLILKGLLLAISVQVVILIPFIISGTLTNIGKTLHDLAGSYGMISMNAANIWELIFDFRLWDSCDDAKYSGHSLKSIGQNMYWLAMIVVLLPFLRYFILKIKKQFVKIEKEQILLMFAFSALVFFFFNTQMHERYSYPAILFTAAYATVTSRWYLYVLTSLGYYLNCDALLQSIKGWNYNTPWYNLYNIAWIFLLCIIIFAFLHLKLYIKTTRQQKNGLLS